MYHGSTTSILGYYNDFTVAEDTVIIVNTGGIGGVKYIDKCFWCSKGGIPAVSKSQVENFNISIPSFEEQQQIVSNLDKFDKLCNNLTSGIPAEIEAIQKAYEYHRNKLRTFA